MSVVVIMIMMKDYVGLEESKRALLQKDSLFFVAFCPFPISFAFLRQLTGQQEEGGHRVASACIHRPAASVTTNRLSYQLQNDPYKKLALQQCILIYQVVFYPQRAQPALNVSSQKERNCL